MNHKHEIEKLTPLQSIADLKNAIIHESNPAAIIGRCDESKESVPQEEILKFLLEFLHSTKNVREIGRTLWVIGSINKDESFPYDVLIPFLTSNQDYASAAIKAFLNSNSEKAASILFQQINNVVQKWKKPDVINTIVRISESETTLKGIIDIYKETKIPDLRKECLKALEYLSLKREFHKSPLIETLLQDNKVRSINQLEYKSHKKIALENWQEKIAQAINTGISKMRPCQTSFDNYFIIDIAPNHYITIKAQFFGAQRCANGHGGRSCISHYKKYFFEVMYFCNTTVKSGYDIINHAYVYTRLDGDFEGDKMDEKFVSEVNDYFLKIENFSTSSDFLDIKQFVKIIPHKHQIPIIDIDAFTTYIHYLLINGYKDKIPSALYNISDTVQKISKKDLDYLLSIENEF